MRQVADERRRAEAMRIAEKTELFGLRGRMLEKLRKSDFRNALMLCRRALADEEEHFATQLLPSPRVEHMEARQELLYLLKLINTLRLEVRTRAAV
ncbi:MAG: hypothetical protein ACR2IE_08480 [Candidatus Sumerlaeaceae bacterium]